MLRRPFRIITGIAFVSVVIGGYMWVTPAYAEDFATSGIEASLAARTPGNLTVSGSPALLGFSEGSSSIIEVDGHHVALDAGKRIRVKLSSSVPLDASSLQCRAHVYDGNLSRIATDKRLTITAVAGESDTYEITLSEGVYNFDEITISARNVLGNVLPSIPITSGGHVETEDHSVLDYLAVGKDVLGADDLLEIGAEEIGNQSGDAAILKPKTDGYSEVRPAVKDLLYPLYVKAGQIPSMHISYAGISGVTVDAPTLEAMTWNAQSKSFGKTVGLAPEGAVSGDISADGTYDITLAYRGQTIHKTVIVDNHSPLYYSATYGLEVPDGGNKLNIADGDSDKLAATSGWISFDIKDSFNGEKFAGEENASGIAHVTVDMPFSPEGADPDKGPTTVRSLEATYDGAASQWRVLCEEPGTYYFDRATFHATDKAGNDGGAVGLTRLLSYDEHNKPISQLHVLSPSARPNVSLDVLDQDGVPAAAASGYHRGGVRFSIHISGFFAKLLQKSGLIDAMEFVYCVTDAAGTTTEHVVPLSELSSDGEGAWHYDVGSNEEPPTEGTYTAHIRFPWVTGQVSSEEKKVVCDHSAPKLGALSASTTGSVAWGYLFATSDTTFTASVQDAVSGVDTNSLVFSPVGVQGVLSEATLSDSGDGSKTITFTLSGDRSRLRLDGSTICVSDKAGNTVSASLFDLAKREESNVPAGVKGVVVDTKAPELSVTYDNNDAQNGSYYRANRTATITLRESNFDLTRENEPDRIIATASVDGRPSRQLSAKDFENPSGDGITWVATLSCASDGDWTIDASYTDPAGHVSNAIVDSFVIDTIPPVITVAFNNNDARNGMYFNAPRTATISVFERNFSANLASVAPQAKEGIVPAASSWTAADGTTWQCFVSFTSDGRYSIAVTCTDLAGNVAHEVITPEFVIDMTAPQVTIDRVSEHSAYAGEIAPYASTSDTNYDLSASGITLVGAHRDTVTWMAGERHSYDTTGEVRDYANFERKLENDDVYTLTAKATDLAGNTAEKSVTFSVNRFGSTYYFSGDTASVRGEYLQKAHELEVTEVNVSGLNTEASHVEVVKNSEVVSLTEGKDYSTETSDDSGWSATTYKLPAQLFSQDGYYRVLLNSHDLAGNLSQNTMSNKNETRDADAGIAFAIDSTAPTAHFAGVVSDGVYFESHRQTLPQIHDNLEVDRATLTVDGYQVASWNAEQIKSGDISYVLPSDARAHDMSLSVWDRAGNKTVYTASNVVVASDLFSYLTANPVRLFRVICVGIVAFGVLGTLVYVGARHMKATADERDPFGSSAGK